MTTLATGLALTTVYTQSENVSLTQVTADREKFSTYPEDTVKDSSAESSDNP